MVRAPELAYRKMGFENTWENARACRARSSFVWLRIGVAALEVGGERGTAAQIWVFRVLAGPAATDLGSRCGGASSPCTTRLRAKLAIHRGLMFNQTQSRRRPYQRRASDSVDASRAFSCVDLASIVGTEPCR
jgi:hypothetical protein